MGIQGVGTAFYLVELEVDAGTLARFIQPRVDAFHRAGTELGFQVLAAIHAFRWQVWVQLEGMPMHVSVADLGGSEGLFETPLAHETPWADHIREDVDPHGIL